MPVFSFFFFNDTATTEIYTLSLHDALPISICNPSTPAAGRWVWSSRWPGTGPATAPALRRHDRLRPERRARRAELPRSEEHTSELQSRLHLVCRLLLEKKKYLQAT